ncbi:MAG: septum formation initiator family protein [bacterium]
MFYRVINVLLLLLAVVVAGVAAYFILPVYFEHRSTKLAIADLDKNLNQQKQEAQELRREIDALKRDTRAIERVAREKFGYCRENEKIYHFDEPVGLGPSSSPATRPILETP